MQAKPKKPVIFNQNGTTQAGDWELTPPDPRATGVDR
jgi:hypothetical protein